jgi:DNA-binding NarL/FixJ family response regulator
MQRVVPELCAVNYSVYEDSNQLFLATPGGASAYLLKRTAPDRLIEPALSGLETFSCQDLLVRVRQYFEAAMAFVPGVEAPRDLESLTPREQELLALLSRGYEDKEIATRLGISAWTVRGHLKHIFGKLKVHTRTQAAVRFLNK